VTTTSLPPGVMSAAARHGITPAQYQANIAAGLKWCRACQDWQSRQDYKPSASTYDGLRPLCTRHYASPKPITHGLTGYRRGCRCDKCRSTHNAAQRRAKARRIADPTGADRAGHGKATTYDNYGCRCESCKEAKSERNRANRLARLQEHAA